jgi:hypothetical protein
MTDSPAVVVRPTRSSFACALIRVGFLILVLASFGKASSSGGVEFRGSSVLRPLTAQTGTTTNPPNTIDAKFMHAPTLDFPNQCDSNSPAMWDGDTFYVFNSFAGASRRAAGSGIATAVDTDPGGESSSYANGDEGGGRWFEAVIRDSETGRT